jgi:signal transduction histidine kinase
VAAFATATDLRKLQEQFVANLLNQLDELTKTKQSLDRRAVGLERIDRAVGDLTSATGVQRLLETLLPRLADAIGAAALAVELSEPAGKRVVGHATAAGAAPPGTPPGAPVERRRPLDFGGRSLGVVSAFYTGGGDPTVDDEALLQVVAHQLALAVENARLYEHEQRLRSAIEAQDRRKDYFLAVLAHELRAPLAPILSAMQLIGKAGLTPELLRSARKVVERQVRYQAGLLDDLLDLTRIDRDKIELRFRVVDVRGIVAAALEVSRPVIEQRRQHLTVSVPDAPLTVTADPVRLEQVLINLLGNATKYTPMAGDVAVTVEAEGGLAILTVSDSGEGISAAMLDRVFEPFVQVGAAEGRPRPAGLGIGLALTRRLVELHGGAVEARSAGIGRGSECIVALTGFGQPEDVRATEASGFDAHLLKPAAIEEITRVLARRRRAAGA